MSHTQNRTMFCGPFEHGQSWTYDEYITSVSEAMGATSYLLCADFPVASGIK